VTDLPLELVCDSCGYHCCAAGEMLCDGALEGSASFCTRDEWERRRVEGDPFDVVAEAGRAAA
jgi:hypothetical protein